MGLYGLGRASRNEVFTLRLTGGSHQFGALRRYNQVHESDSKIGESGPLFGA